MARETKLPISKRINLDAELAKRIRAYRFRMEIDSENQAFRDLLQLGLDAAYAHFDHTPSQMVAEAKKLLEAAEKAYAPPLVSEETKLPIAKRINLDTKLAQRISEYRICFVSDSENQAFRDLLQLGLDAADGTFPECAERLVAKAKIFLHVALNTQVDRILRFAALIHHSEDPEAILSATADVFNEDGTLKGL